MCQPFAMKLNLVMNELQKLNSLSQQEREELLKSKYQKKKKDNKKELNDIEEGEVENDSDDE